MLKTLKNLLTAYLAAMLVFMSGLSATAAVTRPGFSPIGQQIQGIFEEDTTSAHARISLHQQQKQLGRKQEFFNPPHAVAPVRHHARVALTAEALPSPDFHTTHPSRAPPARPA